MNQLQVFAFDSHAVRVVIRDGEPWFVAKDVCLCVNISNHRDALRALDDDEKDDVGISDAIGRVQKTTIINESGLYALILRCQGAIHPGHPAHTFRKFVTAEVLPSLRKTGQYAMPGVAAPASATDARLDRVIGLLEKLIEVLPVLVKAAGKRGGRRARPMSVADMGLIKSMKADGAPLGDIVQATGFSQTQVFYVLDDQVRIKPDGRVVLVHRTRQALTGQPQQNGGAA